MANRISAIVCVGILLFGVILIVVQLRSKMVMTQSVMSSSSQGVVLKCKAGEYPAQAGMVRINGCGRGNFTLTYSTGRPEDMYVDISSQGGAFTANGLSSRPEDDINFVMVDTVPQSNKFQILTIQADQTVMVDVTFYFRISTQQDPPIIYIH